MTRKYQGLEYPDQAKDVLRDAAFFSALTSFLGKQKAAVEADIGAMPQADFEKNVLDGFFRSKSFIQHHYEGLKTAIRDEYGSPSKVAKAMGVKNTKLVAQLLLEVVSEKIPDARKTALKLVRSEKLDKDPREMVKELQRGRVPGGNGGSRSIKVDLSTLKKCGFTEPKDRKLQEIVEGLAQALVSGDLILTKREHLRLKAHLKKANIDPDIEDMNLNNLIKMLFKAKVIGR